MAVFFKSHGVPPHSATVPAFRRPPPRTAMCGRVGQPNVRSGANVAAPKPQTRCTAGRRHASALLTLGKPGAVGDGSQRKQITGRANSAYSFCPRFQRRYFGNFVFRALMSQLRQGLATGETGSEITSPGYHRRRSAGVVRRNDGAARLSTFAASNGNGVESRHAAIYAR